LWLLLREIMIFTEILFWNGTPDLELAFQTFGKALQI
jgi:hypothetical protein